MNIGKASYSCWQVQGQFSKALKEAVGLLLQLEGMKWGDPLIISSDPHANFVRNIICRCDNFQLLHWQVTIFEEIF